MTRLLAMLALLTAGPSNAVIDTATNQMPAAFHNLMDTEGAGMAPIAFRLRPQTTNLLRNLKPAQYTQFIPLERQTKKVGWRLWNNSSIKRVERNAGAPGSSDLASLSQYEFDINYSFSF